MEIIRHPDIENPDSVTHFICPDSFVTDVTQGSTHHLVPHSEGRRHGEPVQVNVCLYCGKAEGWLRALYFGEALN